MAIVLVGTGGSRASGGDITTSITIASGEVLIAICSAQDSNTNLIQTSGIARDGQNFTKITEFGGSGGSGQPVNISAWYLATPNVGTADSVVDFASGINECTVTYFILSGADADALINGTADGDTDNGFAPAMSVTTDADDCFIIGGICSEAEITGYGTGQTERSNYDDQSFENTNTSTEPGGSAGAQAHSYNMNNGAPYAQIQICIKPSAGAATISSNRLLRGLGA